MDPFETLTATQSPVDPFGTPPATPRPAAEVADFVNALWSRGGARGARHWGAEGATGGEHASAGGACSLADGGVAGVRAERATGAPKARRAERASAQAEHAGTRWSHRRSADNFTVQRSAPTGHLVACTLEEFIGPTEVQRRATEVLPEVRKYFRKYLRSYSYEGNNLLSYFRRK